MVILAVVLCLLAASTSGQFSNETVDDTDKRIQYEEGINWRHHDCSSGCIGGEVTYANSGSFTFEFRGVAIYLRMGADSNGSAVNVNMDGQMSSFDTNSQVTGGKIFWSATDLDENVNHTIVVSHAGAPTRVMGFDGFFVTTPLPSPDPVPGNTPPSSDSSASMVASSGSQTPSSMPIPVSQGTASEISSPASSTSVTPAKSAVGGGSATLGSAQETVITPEVSNSSQSPFPTPSTPSEVSQVPATRLSDKVIIGICIGVVVLLLMLLAALYTLRRRRRYRVRSVIQPYVPNVPVSESEPPSYNDATSPTSPTHNSEGNTNVVAQLVLQVLAEMNRPNQRPLTNRSSSGKNPPEYRNSLRES